MSFDPQPLVDGDIDAITCYVTNQPIQLRLAGSPPRRGDHSDFGLTSYGDMLFASKKESTPTATCSSTTSPRCSTGSTPTSPIRRPCCPC